MRRLLIFLSVFILSANAGAQVLKGIIYDSEGKPVPFATVYINELRHGTTANIKGEYLIKLNPGRYTFFFQSLGFSPTVKDITITEGEKVLDIRLQVQYYVIPEVRVTSTGEDPAYAIMRKAIGMAPYYLNQVSHYKAEVYIKGSFILRKIPKLMQRNMQVNEEQIKTGEAYFIESFNEIEFRAPDRYDQRVISQQSTLPDAGNTDISPMDVVKASFYEPVLADVAISPLAPNAMAHYKYRYEGSTPQGQYIINKISVIPRRKSQQVFSGTIYIIEGLWCLHSLELRNENLAGSIDIRQVYTPVQDDIWMPVSHNFEVEVSIVGVEGDGEYGSAITYNNVEPNLGLKKPDAIEKIDFTVQVDTTSLPLSKEKQKIEEILSKDELSNRDMARLSRLMDKEAENTHPENKELLVVSERSFTVDDNADKRDSSYWNNIRPIPLSEEELRSIRKNDSIKAAATSRLAAARINRADTAVAPPSKKQNVARAVNSLVFGKSINSSSGDFGFRFNGLFNTETMGFNSVEGLWYGTDMRFRWNIGDGNTLTVRPGAEWAFARERLRWTLNGSYYYNRMKQARFLFWFGDETRDYNRLAGISPTLNMFTSLFYKDNYLRLYHSRYATISHRQEIVNGFYAEVRYNWESRAPLSNNTQFSFLRRDENYTVNLPRNYFLPEPPDPDGDYAIVTHTHQSASLELTLIPRQRYSLTNNIKSSAGSDYPTFSIFYKHGITSMADESRSSFDLLTLEASKSQSIGAFAEYSWMLRGGGFLRDDGVQFQDFVHFNTQSLPVLLTNYREVFMLKPYYSLSTPGYFIEAHGRFTTPYLLIKLLPFFSNSLMRENLSVAYLYTPERGSYTEFGYALSEVFLLGRIGVFVGFSDLDFESAGFRFTFIFN